MGEWDLIREVIAGGSPVLMLALFIFALMKGWFVLGKTHEKTEERETFWQNLALSSLGVAARSSAVATEVVRPQLSREDQARLRLLEQLVRGDAEDDDPPPPPPRRRTR